MQIWVLDENLERAALIDAYESLIWAKRYQEQGDCEIYTGATQEALEIFRQGRYLWREDDDMICQIRGIEITTDAEKGDHIAVTGVDAKAILAQRVIWETSTMDGSVEAYLRQLVADSMINGADPARRMLKPNGGALVKLGASSGMTAAATGQASYTGVEDRIRELCKVYGWGYRMTLDAGQLAFEIFSGRDVSDSVIFSRQFENLIQSKATDDETDVANVALVAGEGEGPERARAVAGDVTSYARHEIYVDARDVSSEISFQELQALYPGGTVTQIGGAWCYRVSPLVIQVLDDRQLAALQTAHPDGTVTETTAGRFFSIPTGTAAQVESETPDSGSTATLEPEIYTVYLLQRGYEALAEHGARQSFDGQINPSGTFAYKEDWDLGDIVSIEPDFGTPIRARIIEIVESDSTSGYRLEPKLEYLS